jgi:FtsH-binding integral membrane protein
VLEIFIAFVAPLGIFIYITRFTESPRYVWIIAGLLVPATIKIRGEKDTSNRKDFRDGLKGIWLILAIILGIGAVGLFLWRSFGSLQDMIDKKPMSVIAITLILILIYLIKLCNKKK